ncbi:DEAD/DEAH box helicase family protein [Isobaculum melis]|uniref:AAA domain-containing protein n=1 Tax=Isobaculum melis TaxID=142588 RepID=A0A1H9SFE3_9LACT|nr:AAA family ATPase [Isobaculum melis]SER83691.1 AAA domain-containing protein [Isobaculum melis]
MGLIVIIGPQAVGKMTVGKALEEQINGKLLYNHQTIDLFANYLGYNQHAFRLSDMTRKELFKAFVENRPNNLAEHLIFTVLINFDLDEDIAFLNEISQIFLTQKEPVYFIELETDLKTRLERNVQESRLLAKPSKRDLNFSRKELLNAHQQHRLNTSKDEMAQQFPQVHYLKIDNTYLPADQVASQIVSTWFS